MAKTEAQLRTEAVRRVGAENSVLPCRPSLLSPAFGFSQRPTLRTITLSGTWPPDLVSRARADIRSR
jgi:hypothetical protein